MTRTRHLGDETLARLAATGSAAEANEARHLASCPRCASGLASTRRLMSLLRPGALSIAAAVPVPGPVLGRAIRARRRRPAPVKSAALIEARRPGASLEAPAGLRSAAAATRQWLFRVGEVEVELQAFPEGPESRRLLGQVQGASGAVADLPVHLRHDGPQQMAVTDALGEFSLGPVRGRHVRVIVETDHEVASLDLGPLPGPDDEN